MMELVKKKQAKGITLIALIITIIVLLVLAGVSLSMVLGNNGVLKQAQNATIETRNAEEKEKIEMAVVAAQIAGNGMLTTKNLKTELDKVFNNSEKVKETNVRRLPAEYQEVEYIESTGTQYIDTEYMINEHFKYNIKFSITDKRTATNIWPMLMATQYKADSSDGKSYEIMYTPSTKKLPCSVEYNLYEIYTINFKLGTTKINDISYENNKKWNGEPYGNVFIFNRNCTIGATSDASSIAKIYYAQIYDGDVLKRNLIPCYCTTTVTNAKNTQCPTGTIGMYDTVEGKFYTNQGSDMFRKGKNIQTSETQGWNYEIDDREYIINNDGKVEQVTVEEQQNTLPDEYQQVEYIESTGNQYIDTKYMINENFKYKLKYAVTDIRNGGNIWPLLIGACGVANASDGKNYTVGYALPVGESNLYKIRNVEFKSGKIILDGVEREDSRIWKGSPSNTVYLFNVYTSDQGVPNAFYSFARIYNAQIYDGDVLKRDLIPCYCTTTVTSAKNTQCPTGTMGMYDTVEGKFYTNQGRGDDFIPGPDL